MVAKQLFQRPRRLAGLAVALAIGGAGQASAESPAVLVDLRADPAAGGGEVGEALGDLPELTFPDDPGVRAALAGLPSPGTAQAGAEALALASEAYGELDCDASAAAAKTAVREYAAARAGQTDEDAFADELERAHIYQLLCAGGREDASAAQLAAKRLHNLGVSERPAQVPAELWDRVPAVDVKANVRQVALSVTVSGESEGKPTQLWIDHLPRDVGPDDAGPDEVLVPEGEVLVAAASGHRAAAKVVPVEGDTSISISLAPTDDRWGALRRAIATWQAGREVSPVEIANFLQRLEARILVVRRPDEIEIWGRADGARVAERLAAIGEQDPERIAHAVAGRVEAWEPQRRRGPDPDRPLLREQPADRRAERDSGGTSWWVYASIIGAVGLGAAFVIGNDMVGSRQRIELTFP